MDDKTTFKHGDLRIATHKGGQLFKQVYAVCSVCGEGRWTCIQKGGRIPEMDKACSRKVYLEKHPEYGSEISAKSKIAGARLELRALRSALGHERFLDPNERRRLSEIQRQTFANDPDIAKRISKTMKARLSLPEEKQKRSLSAIKSHKDHPRTVEVKKRISESNKRHWADDDARARRTQLTVASFTPSRRQRASERMKARQAVPGVRERQSERMKSFYSNNPQARAKASQRLKDAMANPSNRERVRQASKDRWANPKNHAKYVGQLKDRWANPEFKQKTIPIVMKALSIRPNKPELSLQSILDEMFPREWKYTGDGSFIIGGLNPDFVNVNGDKKLLEMYGDFWHSDKKVRSWTDTELGRMMVFHSYGYETLVIWQHELKEPETLRAKLKQFHDMKVRHHK